MKSIVCHLPPMNVVYVGVGSVNYISAIHAPIGSNNR